MSSYQFSSSSAIASSAIGSVALPGPGHSGDGAVIVAVPVSALSWPVRDGAGGRSALVARGAAPVTSGQQVAWCKVVAVAPAVVRRDRRVQVAGHPCEHARLGGLEQELDARCGAGTIDRVAAGVRLGGKVKGTARREMSVAFTLRAVLLMTLMPQADQREVLATLYGDLLVLPWQRAHVVPSSTVFSTWRAAIGSEPLQELQDLLLPAVAAEYDHADPGDDHADPGDDHADPGDADPGDDHADPGDDHADPGDDHPGDDHAAGQDAARLGVVGGGLRLGAIDGSVTRMPDSAANRATFATAGRDGEGFPQVRHLLVSDAVDRATLAVVRGPAGGDKGEAEQALLDRALTEYPQVFTFDRLWVLDRNFPGVPRIARMTARTHVLIRVKSDIRLQRIADYAPDGSYLARINGGGTTLTVRVIEYHVDIDATTTPELFCLITDLLDHHKHPAHLLAAAYRWRWDGSETALREAKSAIAGAGPGTGAMLRSQRPDLIHQEHAAWVTATELVRATIRSTAAGAPAFGKGPRTGEPVHPRDLSFTTARRTLIAAVAAGTATASLPAPARAAAHERALAHIATAKVSTDRHRHRPHKIKSRQPFGHAPREITTHTATATVRVCTPSAAA